MMGTRLEVEQQVGAMRILIAEDNFTSLITADLAILHSPADEFTQAVRESAEDN